MKVLSLSGHEMKVSDDDLALIVMSDVRWKSCTVDTGEKVIGPMNAWAIREALRAEGFEIVRLARGSSHEPR